MAGKELTYLLFIVFLTEHTNEQFTFCNRKINRQIKINQLLQPKNQIELRFNWDKCEKSLSLRSILKLERLSKARKMREKRFSINPKHHISLESNWIHSFYVIKSLLKLAFHSNWKFPRYNFVNQTWTVSKIAWIAFAACMQHSNVGGKKIDVI